MKQALKVILSTAILLLSTASVVAVTYCMPTPSRKVTSKFGARWGRQHKGLDIKVQIGDTIRAAFDGVVKTAQYNKGGYGYYVIIQHEDGFETLYGHLSKFIVRPGQVVKAGMPIGLGGNTGRSTGSHLHLEVRKDGVAQNPSIMFDFPNQTLLCDFCSFKSAKQLKKEAAKAKKEALKAEREAKKAEKQALKEVQKTEQKLAKAERKAEQKAEKEAKKAKKYSGVVSVEPASDDVHPIELPAIITGNGDGAGAQSLAGLSVILMKLAKKKGKMKTNLFSRLLRERPCMVHGVIMSHKDFALATLNVEVNVIQPPPKPPILPISSLLSG